MVRVDRLWSDVAARMVPDEILHRGMSMCGWEAADDDDDAHATLWAWACQLRRLVAEDMCGLLGSDDDELEGLRVAEISVGRDPGLVANRYAALDPFGRDAIGATLRQAYDGEWLEREVLISYALELADGVRYAIREGL